MYRVSKNYHINHVYRVPQSYIIHTLIHVYRMSKNYFINFSKCRGCPKIILYIFHVYKVSQSNYIHLFMCKGYKNSYIQLYMWLETCTLALTWPQCPKKYKFNMILKFQSFLLEPPTYKILTLRFFFKLFNIFKIVLRQ